jgi:deoxyribonuclease-1
MRDEVHSERTNGTVCSRLPLFLSLVLALGLSVSSNESLAAEAIPSFARSLYLKFQTHVNQAKEFFTPQSPEPLPADRRFISLDPKLKPFNGLGSPKNFSEAKRAARQIYKVHQLTFYCGCRFDNFGNINLNSCGYQVQDDPKRAARLEWEHLVPVSQIAFHLPCWQKKLCSKGSGKLYKGRDCCRKIDIDFAKMEADLHNLVPEIGELNACRSNYRFGILPHIAPGQFGQCEFKVDRETRRVEPQRKIRGMIARTYLYINDTYGLRLSDAQRALFNSWSKQFPPAPWEMERNNKIAQIQGNHNRYVSDYPLGIK